VDYLRRRVKLVTFEKNLRAMKKLNVANHIAVLTFI